MTQEFVTLPRHVAEHAVASIEILNTGKWAQVTALAAALRAALEQQQGEQEQASTNTWSTADGIRCLHCNFPLSSHIEQRYCQRVEDGSQANQPAMTPIAQRKLDSLLAEGYTISGYSIYHEQKHQHGFITGAGLVGWWKPDGVEYPQPKGEPSTVAFCHVGDVVVCDNDSLLRQLGVKRSDKLYLHPQDLNCKSKQALLATLWGYTKEQPKREPLTDEKIIDIADDYKTQWVHGGQTYDQFDSMAFARAIEAAHNIK